MQVTTVKDFVGTPASISIGAGPQSKAITGNDQVSATVEAGTSQALSETLSDAQKALYDTTVRCTGDQGAETGIYSRQLAVGTDPVTCTFVNTRKQGRSRSARTSSAPGRTSRSSSSSTARRRRLFPPTARRGALTVDTGSYTLSEAYTTPSDGDLYTSTYSCTKNGQAYIASASGQSVQVAVGKSDAVVCTFVNTRRMVNVTVEKDWGRRR